MSKLFILIPPSEGKNSGGTDNSLKNISQPVCKMIDTLQSYSGDWEKLLGVKGKALQKVIQINKEILTSPTMPAIERYSGVVYKAIDYASLNTKAKKFFNTHVRIVSAVFGLVSPDDLIPNYKLKIDKLSAQKFWNEILMAHVQNNFCFNLLPKAHQKAITPSNNLNIDFVVKKNGKIIHAGHKGKHIKGRFIRWLCENQITAVDKFDGFKEDGYQWTGTQFLNQ